MANWAYVENNEIVGVYDILPKNWKNISGLNLSASNFNFLKSLGWYPVQKESITFNENTHRITNYEYSIINNEVLETPIISEVEEYNFQERKNIFLNELRAERNLKLLQSDWSQLSDIQLNMEQSEKDCWTNYRQQLRDITIEYSENDVIDLINVSWPNL